MDRRRVTLARLERTRDDVREIRKPNPLERRCVERGVRLSAQRRVILQALAEAADHLSASEIHDRVELHGISIPTVYRMLNSLTDVGVMKRHGFGSQAAKFEVVHPSSHDHLVDVDTGRIVELTDPDLANLLEETATSLGYRLVSYRLRLFGAPQLAGEVRRTVVEIPMSEPPLPLDAREKGSPEAGVGSVTEATCELLLKTSKVPFE